MSLVAVTSTEIGIADSRTVLIWCEQGRSALEQATTLADAKGLLDVTSTLDHAVRLRDMNAETVIAASKLKLLAERRVGEMIAAEREAERLESHGGSRRGHLHAINVTDDDVEVTAKATLAEHGITRNEASSFAKLAAVPADEFDQALDDVAASATERKVGVTRAAVMRAIDPEGEKRPDERAEDFERFIDACAKANRRAEAALATIRFGIAHNGHPWPESSRNVALRTLDELATHLAAARKELTR